MRKKQFTVLKAIILTATIQLMLNGLTLFSQTYDPSGLHIAGGFYKQEEYLFDWSAGEQIAIQTFQSSSPLFISAGLLQCKNIRTTQNQIDKFQDIIVKAGPIPTYSTLFLSSREIGVLIQSVQLINAQGVILQKIIGPFDGTHFKQSIEMNTYSSGYYFVLIEYKTDDNLLKTKIIKVLK